MSIQSISLIRNRARMLTLIREFFAQKRVLEVTTPVLGARSVTDPHISSFKLNEYGQTYFLQTSPEFAMKRLLAAGTGSIYQICPAFRAGESGRYHNPEFTMLEWYRPGFGLTELMDELSELIALLCQEFDVVFEDPERHSFKELFLRRFAVNPHQADTRHLAEVMSREFPDLGHHIPVNDEGVDDDMRDLLFSEGIEPGFQQPQYVVEFPASQASLAKVEAVDGDDVAMRFELYWRGIELANGYDELTDASVLRVRIERDNRIRKGRNLPIIDADERLLSAMAQMPVCTGVAVGLDRLIMLLTGKSSLDEVLNFPFADA